MAISAAPTAASPLDQKILEHFPGLVVRKDLTTDPKASPWQISSVKPIQVAGVNHDEFLAARARFSTDEWMDVVMQSVGFNPVISSAAPSC